MSHFDHFSLLAPYYDRLIPAGSREILLQLLALSPDTLVLDAGGGTGRIAQILQRHSHQVVVADISFGMLRQARFKDGLQTIQAPLELLPFRDGIFDRIVMVDAFHHVADRAQAARELYRILKPGGRIVIEEPDIRTKAVKCIAIWEKIFLMRSHFCSPRQIAELFVFSSNIEDIDIDSEGSTAWITIKK